MTKQERNRINREIRIERALRDYYFKLWQDEDNDNAYIAYRVHDYCLYMLEHRI